uniref:Uncharacterized protein n=1 Tax=Ciona savignyi TaxID=51511 RepID=H2Y8D6_CIOSA
PWGAAAIHPTSSGHNYSSYAGTIYHRTSTIPTTPRPASRTNLPLPTTEPVTGIPPTPQMGQREIPLQGTSYKFPEFLKKTWKSLLNVFT